jgi:hypothetical protein
MPIANHQRIVKAITLVTGVTTRKKNLLLTFFPFFSPSLFTLSSFSLFRFLFFFFYFTLDIGNISFREGRGGM